MITLMHCCRVFLSNSPQECLHNVHLPSRFIVNCLWNIVALGFDDGNDWCVLYVHFYCKAVMSERREDDYCSAGVLALCSVPTGTQQLNSWTIWPVKLLTSLFVTATGIRFWNLKTLLVIIIKVDNNNIYIMAFLILVICPLSKWLLGMDDILNCFSD